MQNPTSIANIDSLSHDYRLAVNDFDERPLQSLLNAVLSAFQRWDHAFSPNAHPVDLARRITRLEKRLESRLPASPAHNHTIPSKPARRVIAT